MHESKNGVKENKTAETKLSQSAKGERTWEWDFSLFWVYITFIASISFKTLGTETSVSFICKPYLAQKVLSRATATMTKVLENS